MLTPKYKLNQKVYGVSVKTESIRKNVECDLCGSTGVVKVQDYDCQCPKCNGKTESYIKNSEYYISFSGKIGKIETEEYDKSYYKHKSRITYMLDVTGVGSGSVWDEEMLFPSKEDAEQFCKEYVPSYDTYPLTPIRRENKC